jgi:hypothetical protein
MQTGDEAVLSSIVGQKMICGIFSGNRQTLAISGVPVGTYVLTLSGKKVELLSGL